MGKYAERRRRGQLGATYVSSGGYEPSGGGGWIKPVVAGAGSLLGTGALVGLGYGLKRQIWDPRYNPDTVMRPAHKYGQYPDETDQTKIGKEIPEWKPNSFQQHFMSKLPVAEGQTNWSTGKPLTPQEIQANQLVNQENPVPTPGGDWGHIKNYVSNWWNDESNGAASFLPTFAINLANEGANALTRVGQNTVDLGQQAVDSAINQGKEGLNKVFSLGQTPGQGATLNELGQTVKEGVNNVNNAFDPTKIVNQALGNTPLSNQQAGQQPPADGQPQPQGAAPAPQTQGAAPAATTPTAPPAPTVAPSPKPNRVNVQTGTDPIAPPIPTQNLAPAPQPQQNASPGGGAPPVKEPVVTLKKYYGGMTPRYANGGYVPAYWGGSRDQETWRHWFDDLYGNRFTPTVSDVPETDPRTGVPTGNMTKKYEYPGWTGLGSIAKQGLLNWKTLVGAIPFGMGLYNMYNPNNLAGSALNHASNWLGSAFAGNKPFSWESRYQQGDPPTWSTLPFSLPLLWGGGALMGNQLKHNVYDTAKLLGRMGKTAYNNISDFFADRKEARELAKKQRAAAAAMSQEGGESTPSNFYNEYINNYGIPREQLPPQFQNRSDAGAQAGYTVSGPHPNYGGQTVSMTNLGPDAQPVYDFNNKNAIFNRTAAYGASIPRYANGGTVPAYVKGTSTGTQVGDMPSYASIIAPLTVGISALGGAGAGIPLGIRHLKKGNLVRGGLGVGGGGVAALLGAGLTGYGLKNLVQRAKARYDNFVSNDDDVQDIQEASKTNTPETEQFYGQKGPGNDTILHIPYKGPGNMGNVLHDEYKPHYWKTTLGELRSLQNSDELKSIIRNDSRFDKDVRDAIAAGQYGQFVRNPLMNSGSATPEKLKNIVINSKLGDDFAHRAAQFNIPDARGLNFSGLFAPLEAPKFTSGDKFMTKFAPKSGTKFTPPTPMVDPSGGDIQITPPDTLTSGVDLSSPDLDTPGAANVNLPNLNAPDLAYGGSVPRYDSGGHMVRAGAGVWDTIGNAINALGKRKNMQNANGDGTEAGYAPYDMISGLYNMGIHRVLGAAMSGAGNMMQSLGQQPGDYTTYNNNWSPYQQQVGPQPQQQQQQQMPQQQQSMAQQTGETQNTPQAGQQQQAEPFRGRYMANGEKENYGGTIGRSLGGLIGTIGSSAVQPFGLMGKFLGLNPGPSEFSKHLQDLGGAVGNMIGGADYAALGNKISGIGSSIKNFFTSGDQPDGSTAQAFKQLDNNSEQMDANPNDSDQSQQQPGNPAQPNGTVPVAKQVDAEVNTDPFKGGSASSQYYGGPVPRYRFGSLYPMFESGGYTRRGRSPFQRSVYMAPMGAGLGALAGGYSAKQRYINEMRNLTQLNKTQDMTQQIQAGLQRGPDYLYNALVGGLGGFGAGAAIGGMSDMMH